MRKSESTVAMFHRFCSVSHMHWYDTYIHTRHSVLYTSDTKERECSLRICWKQNWYIRIASYRTLCGTSVWILFLDGSETLVQCEEICMPESFICTRDSDAKPWFWTILYTCRSQVSFLYDECPECGIHTWHTCKSHGISCIDARSTPLSTSPDGHLSIIYNTYALQGALQRYDFNLMAYLSHAAIFTGNSGA